MEKSVKIGKMRKKGYTPVGLPNELIELIDLVCIEKKGYVSRQDFVRAAVIELLDKLGYYAKEPRMEIEHINVSENFIILKDNKLHTYVSISLTNATLFCNHCISMDCEHLTVARNLPAVKQWAKTRNITL